MYSDYNRVCTLCSLIMLIWANYLRKGRVKWTAYCTTAHMEKKAWKKSEFKHSMNYKCRQWKRFFTQISRKKFCPFGFFFLLLVSLKFGLMQNRLTVDWIFSGIKWTAQQPQSVDFFSWILFVCSSIVLFNIILHFCWTFFVQF